jgi:transcription factor WhiB
MPVYPPHKEGNWTWQEDAACRGVLPDVFFPDEDPARAKAICETCPVRLHCLAFALERKERYGVWGGLTEKERAALSPAEREQILGNPAQPGNPAA